MALSYHNVTIVMQYLNISYTRKNNFKMSLPCSAERGRNVKQKQTLGNQVIRKGWISIPVSLLKGSHRDYWFVLNGKRHHMIGYHLDHMMHCVL